MPSRVTPFDSPQAPRAPWRVGSVPRAGWCCIETTYSHPTPQPKILAALVGSGIEREIARPEDLLALEAVFNRCDAGGRGLLITRDHAGTHSEVNTRAAGWIKALHAEGDALWAWVEWTPWGHSMVNGGEFVHFSTEYDYREFKKVPGGATPTRLTGATITNEPRHARQIPCTNMQTQTMKTDTPHAFLATNSDPDAPKPDITGEPSQLPAVDTDPDDVVPTAENSAPEEEQKAENSEELNGLGIEGACQQLAQLLDLSTDCTPEDLVSTVKNLLSSNQELAAALEQANVATNARHGARNSALRFPNLTACNAATRPLQGATPNASVNVQMGGKLRAVNAQSKSRADFCTAAISAREKQLGRMLTSAEFADTYARANRDFNLGINR